MGPSVTPLNTIGDFDEAKRRSELFFMFSGESEGSEWVSILIFDNQIKLWFMITFYAYLSNIHDLGGLCEGGQSSSTT